ncbi:aspartate/glutamate racemase family protein [Pseudomonas matsuisoli]|uniref:Arylsulfatase n=1 Tax=Pseudomonas matsuisoli TaxID=1515666 RepID=A0A917PPF7_9PSED|nr:aspartate/glutamate racemase family protein [Pseudomonas matsuisoli]GGJ86771.1 arylsulfatase [Pseudomonas matsuisoli]
MSLVRRIFLIHATPVAIQPINEAFARLWPEAEVSNVLDDSLSSDLARAKSITPALKERFLTLARYAESSGADGIMFTCSAFGDAIEACKKALPIPVLKPNEAMIEQALETGQRIILLATFERSISSMAEEFHAAAASLGKSVEIESRAIAGALSALREGRPEEHDRLIAESAATVKNGDVACFAQFSMTSAADGAQENLPCPLLTTPDSAVLKLRRALISD